jgi:ribokinase
MTVSSELVRSADIILCDRHESTAVLRALHDKRHETSTLMDPSVDCSPETMQLLKKMDFPIIPIETLHILFPQESIQNGTKKLSHLLGKPIVVTMGKYGSAVCEDGEFTIHPSFSVRVVDTLGAGDIFRGGFAYGLLQGWDIHHCAQFANSVAALQCTKLGNSTAIPTKLEVIAFQKSAVHLPCSLNIL